MVKDEALNWLAKSAMLGSEAASMIGRRIFEAGEHPIPMTIKHTFDRDSALGVCDNGRPHGSQFFAEAVRTLLPQQLRSTLQRKFRIASATDGSGSMLSWTKDRRRLCGSDDDMARFADKHLLLHASVAFQDLETTEFLLMTGCSIEIEDSDGLTPLLIACQCGNKTFVDVLLTRGALPSHASHNGVTPLHWLILFPVEDMLAFVSGLVDHGADVNHLMDESAYVFVDDLGLALQGSPLCWSVLCCNYTAISTLLRCGAGPSVHYCLRHALQLACAGVLEQLLSQSDILDQISEEFRSDLWFQIGAEARREFHRWCVHGKTYASAYAGTMDVLDRHGIRYPGIPTGYISSPLNRAVMNCNVPLARELIKRGADTAAIDPTTGATLLTDLILCDVVEISDTFKKTQMVKLLLDNGVPTEPTMHQEEESKWGLTFNEAPLVLACSFQAALPIIELLATRYPHQINGQPGHRTPLLGLPGVRSDVEAAGIARLLLSLGADPERENDHSVSNTEGNWTCCYRPIFTAVHSKSLELLKVYLDRGVSPVMGSNGGHSYTVLHVAIFDALCAMQRRSAVRREPWAASFIDRFLSYSLPRANGWVNIADHRGYTPLFYAIFWGLPATVQVLLSHDAAQVTLDQTATATHVLQYSYEHPPPFVRPGAAEEEEFFYLTSFMFPTTPAEYTERLDKIAVLLKAEARL